MRTQKTILNLVYALGSSLLLMLLGFATRRLLVFNFGNDITAASQVVDKLFNFFSIAEFGVGSVISYRLYEQIAAKDTEKISKYMSMYKWAYRAVGVVICVLAGIGAWFVLDWLRRLGPAGEAEGENRAATLWGCVSLAAALAHRPQLLILDEATSSIDTRTEKHIEHGMDRLMAGKTTFVIAHRLSTVRESNAIMVLEDGRIIERGDHNALMAQQGRYYQLCTGKAKLS